LLAATVRSFAHMPLGISDRNNTNYERQSSTLHNVRFPRKYVARSLFYPKKYWDKNGDVFKYAITNKKLEHLDEQLCRLKSLIYRALFILT